MAAGHERANGAIAPMGMRSWAAACFVATSMPMASAAQSLCHAGEQDYFSCSTRPDGRLASVCGNIVEGAVTDDSWLQFRFGRPGNVELAWPIARKGSAATFEGNVFVKYDVVDLRFVRGETLYAVSLENVYSGDDAAKRIRPSGSVSIETGGRRPSTLACRGTGVGRYFATFEALNVALRLHRGDTDIAVEFYRAHPRPKARR